MKKNLLFKKNYAVELARALAGSAHFSASGRGRRR